MSGIDISDPSVRTALLALLGGQDQDLGLHQDSLIGTPGATVGPATAALSGLPQATNYAQNPLATVAEFAAPFGLGAIGSLGLNALDAANTNAALTGQGYPGQTSGLQGFGYGVASLGGLAPGMAHGLGMNTVNEQAIAEINANPQGPADPYSSTLAINTALASLGYGQEGDIGASGSASGMAGAGTSASASADVGSGVEASGTAEGGVGAGAEGSGSADAGGSEGGEGGGEGGGEAKGGLIRGPGTGTSDSIMKAVSNGEFVATEKAVKRFGVELYDALNEAAEKGLDLRVTLHRPVHHNPFLVKAKPVDHDPFSPPVAGARQSKDGHWYVPDPTRVGKWAQVGTRH